MKRTLSLVGLFFVGIGLLFNPVTGVVGTSESLPQAISSSPSTSPVVTTGEPPPEPETTATNPSDPALTSTTTTTTTEPPATTSSTSNAVVTATGPAIQTEWGAFQVEIVVENGVLVSVDTVQQPGDRRSRRINAQALPVYEELAVDAQSADIDVISGATVTWQGYTASLQAALDEVGLG